MDYAALGAAIRAERKRQKKSQKELALEANISTAFMGHIERGTRKASLESIVSIANALNLSLDIMFSASLTFTPTILREDVRHRPEINPMQKEVLKSIYALLKDNLIDYEDDTGALNSITA